MGTLVSIAVMIAVMCLAYPVIQHLIKLKDLERKK
jgi:hypothetical protein